MAAVVMVSLRGHLANYAEQEQRRVRLYEITKDNLRYIMEISKRGRSYSIYAADISKQWELYLKVTAADAIGSID